MAEGKAFLANPKHQYRGPKCGEHDCSARNKKNGDYYKYQSLPIPWTNVNYMENGGTKALLADPKHQYRIS